MPCRELLNGRSVPGGFQGRRGDLILRTHGRRGAVVLPFRVTGIGVIRVAVVAIRSTFVSSGPGFVRGTNGGARKSRADQDDQRREHRGPATRPRVPQPIGDLAQ